MRNRPTSGEVPQNLDWYNHAPIGKLQEVSGVINAQPNQQTVSPSPFYRHNKPKVKKEYKYLLPGT